ncbi:MAG: hypothetical protein AAGA96_12195 [Verrucomicrobiota bacterium]
MNPDQEKRLLELAGQLCDETLSKDGFAELDGMLQHDAEARALYRSFTGMHRQLEDGALLSESQEPAPVIPFRKKPVVGWLVAAAAAVVALLALMPSISEPSPEPIPTAVLTRAIDVEWEHHRRFQATVGEAITERYLRLTTGIAQVQFASGALVTIEGPAKLRIDDPMKCFSHHGKLTAYCPESAHGFEIRFPGGKVIDLGTEFALNTEEGKKTDVHVLDGEVIVARTDEKDQVVVEKNLTGHSAASVGKDDGIQTIAYDDAPFTSLTRETLSRSQPIKLQFDLGHRAGLYQGTNAPAHAAGDMFPHEAIWTQIVGDQSGTFVMADGTYLNHSLEVDYGHGDGTIDWDAEPVDPWGKVYTKATGVFDSALAQDHRPWDHDLGLRVRGLPPGTYRVYALCRSSRRAGAHYEVSFGINLDQQHESPIQIPPMDPDQTPTWEQGVTYEVQDIEVTGPDDWITFITRYSREKSVRSTPHHGRSVLLGLQIVQLP